MVFLLESMNVRGQCLSNNRIISMQKKKSNKASISRWKGYPDVNQAGLSELKKKKSLWFVRCLLSGGEVVRKEEEWQAQAQGQQRTDERGWNVKILYNVVVGQCATHK